MNRRTAARSQGDAFADRVMAAIALVAAPSPTRSFIEAVRSGAGHDAATALSVAWHLGTARDPVAPRVRARSLALVIAVASILASGSMVAASAARVVVPHLERSKVLLPIGSVIIVDDLPESIERADTEARHPVRLTVPVPVVVVVSKKDDPTVKPAGVDGHDPAGTAAPTHGTTSAHPGQTSGGGADPSHGGSNGGDGSEESDQGQSTSGDDGRDQGDDGSSAGTGKDGTASGHGDDHGSGGSGDGDAPESADQGDGSID